MELVADNQILPTIHVRIRNTAFYRFSKQFFASCAWNLTRHQALTQQQQKVIDDLQRDGIAFTDLTTFGMDSEVLKSLIAESIAIADSKMLAEDTADPSHSKFRKNFWYKLLGHSVIRPSKPDIFSRISLSPSLIRTVNKYLKCYSWLMDYNLWLNLPIDEEAKSSQMWHRDHVIYGPDGTYSKKIRKLIKIFIYLHDVTEETGALTYLAGSQKQGPLQHLEPPKAIVEDTLAARVTDEVMEQFVPRDQWINAAGKAGTLIFFDASGYHKGGLVTQDKRILFKIEFGNWLWLNPLYPKVEIKKVDQYRFGGLPELRWAVSIMSFFPSKGRLHARSRNE